MKITVIGCGNAFSKINYNQCFLLEENDKKMLIDFGAKVPQALHHANIDIKEIDAIYISHLHGDHIGGLEEMAFLRYDWVNRPTHYKERLEHCPAPLLIANDHLIKDLWNKSLRGGLESMEGFDASLETYFQPKGIKPNTNFKFWGWNFQLIQQVHIMTGSIISSAFGLFMEKEGYPTLYFTTDSQHCSPRQVEIFYAKADIIFQDCECVGVDTKEKKLLFCSGVHANYAQLAGWKSANSVVLPDKIKSKMWLSHYQDFVSNGLDFVGNSCNWENLAFDDGFKGFLKVGQVIEV